MDIREVDDEDIYWDLSVFSIQTITRYNQPAKEETWFEKVLVN
jgi:hypothetical protein